MKKIMSVLALSLLVATASVSAQEQGRQMPGNRENQPAFGQKMQKGEGSFERTAVVGKRGQIMVNPEVKIDRQIRMLAQALDLTPEQAQRIKDIRMKQSHKELARYHKMEKRAEARMKKHKGSMDEIRSILTADQLQKWNELRGQGHRFHQGEGPQNPMGMKDKVGEKRDFRPGFEGKDRMEKGDRGSERMNAGKMQRDSHQVPQPEMQQTPAPAGNDSL